MAEAYKEQSANVATYKDLTFDERLALLVDYESDVRATKKKHRLINSSAMYFKNAAPPDRNGVKRYNYSGYHGYNLHELTHTHATL